MSGVAFSLKDKTVVAKKGNFVVDVKAGETYYWCTCGLSENQPFCSGAHKKIPSSTGPIAWKAEKDGKAYFCGCKQTQKPPMCDGTHMKIPDNLVGVVTFPLEAQKPAAAAAAGQQLTLDQLYDKHVDLAKTLDRLEHRIQALEQARK